MKTKDFIDAQRIKCFRGHLQGKNKIFNNSGFTKYTSRYSYNYYSIWLNYTVRVGTWRRVGYKYCWFHWKRSECFFDYYWITYSNVSIGTSENNSSVHIRTYTINTQVLHQHIDRYCNSNQITCKHDMFNYKITAPIWLIMRKHTIALLEKLYLQCNNIFLRNILFRIGVPYTTNNLYFPAKIVGICLHVYVGTVLLWSISGQCNKYFRP